MIMSLYFLFKMSLEPETTIFVVSTPSAYNDILTKMRFFYSNLPENMKRKITTNDKYKFGFDNGSMIIVKHDNISSIISPMIFIDYNCILYVNDYSTLNKNIQKYLYDDIFPLINNELSSRIIVSITDIQKYESRYIDDKYYIEAKINETTGKLEPITTSAYNLWSDAINGNNDFILFSTNWDEMPDRDDEWKTETIKMIGVNEFNREYVCNFIS